MYICDRCGDLVEEIPTHKEYEEYWGQDISWEEADNCDCGGAYVEAKECACCGEYMPAEPVYNKELQDEFDDLDLEGTDYEYDTYDICEDCIKKIIKEFKNDGSKE